MSITVEPQQRVFAV